jgi:hypothetical protein
MNDRTGPEPSRRDGAPLNATSTRQEVQEAEAFLTKHTMTLATRGWLLIYCTPPDTLP